MDNELKKLLWGTAALIVVLVFWICVGPALGITESPFSK